MSLVSYKIKTSALTFNQFAVIRGIRVKGF